MVESDEEFTLKQWDEKLFDAINYMILLRAIVIDETTPQGDFDPAIHDIPHASATRPFFPDPT